MIRSSSTAAKLEAEVAAWTGRTTAQPPTITDQKTGDWIAVRTTPVLQIAMLLTLSHELHLRL